MPLTPFNPVIDTVTIGGRPFTLSALPSGIVRYQLLPLADAVADGTRTIQEAFDDMLLHVVDSLSRVDGSITKNDVLNGCSLYEVCTLFKHVIRVSGLQSKEPSEGEAEGAKS